MNVKSYYVQTILTIFISWKIHKWSTRFLFRSVFFLSFSVCSVCFSVLFLNVRETKWFFYWKSPSTVSQTSQCSHLSAFLSRFSAIQYFLHFDFVSSFSHLSACAVCTPLSNWASYFSQFTNWKYTSALLETVETR